jgi:cystathionine beta-lyase
MDEIFDFDRRIERRGTDSLKWGRYEGRDVLPLWVADMDFASPPCVQRALRQLVDFGVFGYTMPPAAAAEAVAAWAGSHYGWRIETDWLVWLPGIVPGLHVACLAGADAGEEVATFSPVYPPFLAAPSATGRVLKDVPLRCEAGRWSMDLAALERAITPATRLLLLSHPQNPTGRAYGREELAALAAVCARHDLVVCSDEIHCDLMLDERPHVPFALLGETVAARTITLMSPAKTFNTPGLSCGFAVIPDPALRARFARAAQGIVPHANAFGYAACRAAYTEGEPWRAALLGYLRGNRELLERYVREELSPLTMTSVEATYLAWIDARGLGVDHPARVFEAAGVGLSDGALFNGPGFVRLNFGCPRATLVEALNRLRRAVRQAPPR